MKVPESEPSLDEGLWLLDAKGAAEYLNISVHHILKLSREGKIPCGKFGMSFRYLKISLYRWAVNQ